MNKSSFILILLFISATFSIDVLQYCTDSDRDKNCNGEPILAVCGWYDSEVDCVSYPCAARFSSVCAACKLSYVEKVTLGRCPSPEQ